MKKLVFAGCSLENIKSFPDKARREAGFQLDRVQHGENPNDWKPMNTIAPGVQEIRVRDSDGIFRVAYIAKFEEAIYVLHAFQKKTQKTSKSDIEAIKKAYKIIIKERNK